MSIYLLKELSPIEDARKEFRDWWQALWRGHSHTMPCPCDGSVEDLEALGYCSYEVGFPDADEGYRITSVVWGGVIQAHTNLSWGCDGKEFVLFSDEWPRYTLYPRIRIAEVLGSSVNQFEEFDVLTQRVFCEMILSQFDVDDLPEFTALFLRLEKNADSGTGLLSGIEEFSKEVVSVGK